MKPLGELNLNKCSLLSSAEEKAKAKRPALELLNILNSKIVEENYVSEYKSEMSKLR